MLTYTAISATEKWFASASLAKSQYINPRFDVSTKYPIVIEPKVKQSIAFVPNKKERNRSFRLWLEQARKEIPRLFPSNISCHSLRHSKAMHLLQADVPLIYIRNLLGHESVVTTEIYAKIDSKRKREVIEKAFAPMIEDNGTPSWQKDKDLLDWQKHL